MVRWVTAAGTPVAAHEASWVRLGSLSALFGVVGADVDGDQEHPAAVGAQEGDGRGQLRSAVVMADPAVDHRAGGLARAAQLDELERGMAGAQGGVDLIGIAVPGLHAHAGRVGLDALGQRVTQREVVGGRGRLGSGRANAARGAAEPEQAVSTVAAAAMASGRRRMPVRRIVTSLRWPQPAWEADRDHRDHALVDTSLNARFTSQEPPRIGKDIGNNRLSRGFNGSKGCRISLLLCAEAPISAARDHGPPDLTAERTVPSLSVGLQRCSIVAVSGAGGGAAPGCGGLRAGRMGHAGRLWRAPVTGAAERWARREPEPVRPDGL